MLLTSEANYFPFFSLQFLLLPFTERNGHCLFLPFFPPAHAVPFIHNYVKHCHYVSSFLFSFPLKGNLLYLSKGGIRSISVKLHISYFYIYMIYKHPYVFLSQTTKLEVHDCIEHLELHWNSEAHTSSSEIQSAEEVRAP